MHRKNLLLPGLLLLLVTFFSLTRARGQQPDRTPIDTLSLSESVERALEENHGILIARNTAEIEANKATVGNAGYLPRLDLVGSAERSVMDKRIEFGNNNPPKEKDQALSTRYNTALTLSYRLFDGFGNHYRFKSLQTGQQLSSAESRGQIEQTLLEAVDSYLRVIGQRRNLNISREAMELSAERYQRAEKQYETGGSSRVDLLNAQVALDQDSVQYIQARADLREAKRNLLVLLGRPPSESIAVQTDLSIDRSLSLPRLQQQAQNENATLTAARLETRQAEWNLKQIRSDQYPSLNLDASYSYSRSEDEVSIQTFQRSDGFTGGLSLQFNIFNGFRRSIEKQNARLRLDNSRERRKQTRKEIHRSVSNTYEQYKTNLVLLDKQQLDVETAELNFRRTREAFRMGQVSNSDFREAQLNLLRARRQLIDLKIAAKLTEIRLFQLSGQLLTKAKVD